MCCVLKNSKIADMDSLSYRLFSIKLLCSVVGKYSLPDSFYGYADFDKEYRKLAERL